MPKPHLPKFKSQPASAPTSPSTQALLSERGKTHGAYADHAQVTQAIKHEIEFALIQRANRSQAPLSDGQREALAMIAQKIGRILAGDPDFADHWDDIAGYAILGRDSPFFTHNHAKE